MEGSVNKVSWLVCIEFWKKRGILGGYRVLLPHRAGPVLVMPRHLLCMAC